MKLGDMVAKALAYVGIEKKEGCGCEERQSWLNAVGDKAVAWWKWLLGKRNA